MSRPEHSLAAWRPTAIVWDLDGSLVESARDLAAALHALRTEQGEHGHAGARRRGGGRRQRGAVHVLADAGPPTQRRSIVEQHLHGNVC